MTTKPFCIEFLSQLDYYTYQHQICIVCDVLKYDYKLQILVELYYAVQMICIFQVCATIPCYVILGLLHLTWNSDVLEKYHVDSTIQLF